MKQILTYQRFDANGYEAVAEEDQSMIRTMNKQQKIKFFMNFYFYI
ncbi:hypothetical protein ABET41_09565 [Metabacillus fastidiosus]|uniref:Uncharacterized protein n=1 Tax=Metabacillus fastidiosus TaxID=1458 RepID=A0ABU6P0J0_9BACI|nr:hypothetical protein [Metabacillus fastidiosus]MED4402610.1 hypothetical protein [Metabacillus fastidiosus]MED4461970.1 hypothetical protein [Metabacillus fastidiosus]